MCQDSCDPVKDIAEIAAMNIDPETAHLVGKIPLIALARRNRCNIHRRGTAVVRIESCKRNSFSSGGGGSSPEVGRYQDVGDAVAKEVTSNFIHRIRRETASVTPVVGCGVSDVDDDPTGFRTETQGHRCLKRVQVDLGFIASSTGI